MKQELISPTTEKIRKVLNKMIDNIMTISPYIIAYLIMSKTKSITKLGPHVWSSK